MILSNFTATFSTAVFLLINLDLLFKEVIVADTRNTSSFQKGDKH